MGRAVRLTLIIFFAVLLTVALCAVSVSNVAAGVAAADNGDKIPVNVSVQGSNVFTYRGAAVYRQSSFDRPLDLPADISLPYRPPFVYIIRLLALFTAAIQIRL